MMWETSYLHGKARFRSQVREAGRDVANTGHVEKAGMMKLLPVCLHHNDKAGLKSTGATVAEGPPF